MKTFYKTCAAILCLTLSLNFSFAQCWNNGDVTTYPQASWGNGGSANSILNNNYVAVYTATNYIFQIGSSSGFTAQWSDVTILSSYLPSNGTPAALTANTADATSTSSGEFGGRVAALKLNIDFADANLLSTSSGLKFGDLVIYGLTTNTDLNGETVRQFLDIANNALGGASTPYSFTDLNDLAGQLDASFASGTPSTFAQQHLKKGWMSGDLTTYPQSAWGNGGIANSTLNNNYGTVYLTTSYIFQIGSSSGFNAQWFDSNVLSSYLPSNGTPAALTSNTVNATSTSSGIFGGQVAALKLDVDFADANILSGNSGLKFGDLTIYGLTSNTGLNGMTVRQFLDVANTAMSGASSPYSFDDLNVIAADLDAAFSGNSVTQWAQLHLKRGWQNGDLTTYPQSAWGDGGIANSILNNNYVSVYLSTGYLFQIGSASGFTAQWTDNTILSTYLPAGGTAGALTMNTADATSTSSGIFGGQVAALKLNIDYADANFLSGNSGLKFGDLTICGLTTNTDLNGMTVRQFLDIANTALGGGTTTDNIADLNKVAAYLDASFSGGTYVDTFAQLHLVNGSCDCGNTVTNTNHCPTATAFNVSTAVGTAVKFMLQGSDADNNPLTYSISQAPAHGTAAIVGGDSVLYTPTAGYFGSDSLHYSVTDGTCSADAVVDITIVMCPLQQGYWKNHTGAWPASAIPMTLGTVSYTKPQLVTILNTPIGSGNKADASLILADPLIGVKLSVANGSPAPQQVLDSIAAANTIIGASVIPMHIRPNTSVGQRMVNLAAFFSNYGMGSLTQGCGARLELNAADDSQPVLEQNFPNPFSTVSSFTFRTVTGGWVTLKIYDLMGREIAALVNEYKEPGEYSVQWNAAVVPAGIYYYRLQQNDFSAVRKMMVVK